LTRSAFDAAVAEAKQRLPGLVTQFIDRVGPLLQLRQQVQQRLGAAAAQAPARNRTLTSLSQLGTRTAAAETPLTKELAQLTPSRFLERLDYARLVHLARYLKALLVRCERAALNPAKDLERARQVAPYIEALNRLKTQPAQSRAVQREIETFRWMIEEFKVSLFAQELGTAMPVSAKRLDQQLELVRQTA